MNSEQRAPAPAAGSASPVARRRRADPEAAHSAVCRLRVPPRLRRLIDAHRGTTPMSAWLREAAAQRLERERDLGPPWRERLAEHDRQLRALGVNLNQLAHAANEGRPVSLPRALLEAIDARIRESRLVLAALEARLPD